MSSNQFLYELSYLYYEKEMTQKEIGDKLGISRVQVSKYLKQARERKIVSVSLALPKIPDKRVKEINAIFQKRFAVQQVLISPSLVSTESKLNHTQQPLLTYAWEVIAHLLPAATLHIGLGWGSTIYQLLLRAREAPIERPNWTVSPLSGGISNKEACFNINLLSQLFSECTQCAPLPLYLPFFLKERMTAMAMRDESCFRQIEERWRQLDVAIFGIGSHSIERSPAFEDVELKKRELRQLLTKGVIGDVATHYFDKEGKLIELESIDNLINISVKSLLNIPERIAVAGSLYKADSIIAALKAGLATTLITDIETVNRLLTIMEEEPAYDN